MMEQIQFMIQPEPGRSTQNVCHYTRALVEIRHQHKHTQVADKGAMTKEEQ
jgi:hypothetical protein